MAFIEDEDDDYHDRKNLTKLVFIMKIDDITDHIGTGQYAAGYIDYTDGKVRFTEAYQYGTTLGRTNNVGKNRLIRQLWRIFEINRFTL